MVYQEENNLARRCVATIVLRSITKIKKIKNQNLLYFVTPSSGPTETTATHQNQNQNQNQNLLYFVTPSSGPIETTATPWKSSGRAEGSVRQGISKGHFCPEGLYERSKGAFMPYILKNSIFQLTPN